MFNFLLLFLRIICILLIPILIAIDSKGIQNSIRTNCYCVQCVSTFIPHVISGLLCLRFLTNFIKSIFINFSTPLYTRRNSHCIPDFFKSQIKKIAFGINYCRRPYFFSNAGGDNVFPILNCWYIILFDMFASINQCMGRPRILSLFYTM